MQHKLSNEWSHDMVWDKIQKSVFWSTGTLTPINGGWELGPLWDVPTQLFCLVCVLHCKWPLLNSWPKKFSPNIPCTFICSGISKAISISSISVSRNGLTVWQINVLRSNLLFMEKQFLQHASLELLTISKKSELLVSMLSCNSRTADS